MFAILGYLSAIFELYLSALCVSFPQNTAIIASCCPVSGWRIYGRRAFLCASGPLTALREELGMNRPRARLFLCAVVLEGLSFGGYPRCLRFVCRFHLAISHHCEECFDFDERYRRITLDFRRLDVPVTSTPYLV